MESSKLRQILTWTIIGTSAVAVGYVAYKGIPKVMGLKELSKEVIVKTGIDFKKSTFLPKEGLLLVPTASITNPTPTEITVRKPTIQLGYSLDGGKTVNFINNSPISSTKKVVAAYTDTDFGGFPILIPYSTLATIAVKKGGYAMEVLNKSIELGKKVAAFIFGKEKEDQKKDIDPQIYDEVNKVLEMQQYMVAGVHGEEDDAYKPQPSSTGVWAYAEQFKRNEPLSGFGATAAEDAAEYLQTLKKHNISLHYKYDYDVYIGGKRIPIKTDWQKI